jgi:hypothetical protein
MDQFFEDGEGSHPMSYDTDGGYITYAQMQFYLNRQKPSNGTTIISTQSFFKYYNTCKRYNLISDCMKEDPECADLSWNEDKGCFVFLFPAAGLVATELSSLQVRGNCDEDDSEFGNGVVESE